MGLIATDRIELEVKDRKLLEGWSRAQRVARRLKIRSRSVLKAGRRLQWILAIWKPAGQMG
jgi:hypothetical protein